MGAPRHGTGFFSLHNAAGLGTLQHPSSEQGGVTPAPGRPAASAGELAGWVLPRTPSVAASSWENAAQSSGLAGSAGCPSRSREGLSPSCFVSFEGRCFFHTRIEFGKFRKNQVLSGFLRKVHVPVPDSLETRSAPFPL